jgi:Ca2+-transporting ATPase
LDNKLNIFEGITRNYLFLGINIIMVGGQILIIFVGGEAFKITRLNSKEWGISVGLGAISLPWGALIRLIPDSWLGACMPWFIRKKWAPETIDDQVRAGHNARIGDVHAKPLRTLSMVRGQRANKHIHRGFREYVRDQTDKVAAKASNITSGSSAEVVLPGGRTLGGR